MKALVKYDLTDHAVELRDVAEPILAPGHVLVAARAVGVCGSDIHMWHNKQSWEVAPPVTLGHETAGVIAAVANDVEGWSVGDRVVCETAATICGTCALCRSGRYNLCPQREGYGATRDGAFGELLLAEPRVLHHIPDNVSFEQAALTEPFAVAYNGVVERASIRPGDLMVVQGVGAIGTLSLQIGLLRGAGTTVMLGTGIDEHRLSIARELGADHTVDISTTDAAEIVAGLGDGLGADLVVDATGVSAALKQSMQLVRPLGSIVKIGWGPEPLGFSLDPLVAKAATLYGSFSHTWTTWERVLALFASGKLDTTRILGDVYALSDWERAFDDMASGRVVKSVMIMPG